MKCTMYLIYLEIRKEVLIRGPSTSPGICPGICPAIIIPRTPAKKLDDLMKSAGVCLLTLLNIGQLSPQCSNGSVLKL